MWKRIDQLTSLSFAEWKTLFSSAFFLPVIALSLRFYGLKRTQDFLAWYAPPPLELAPGPIELQKANRIAKLINISARHGLYKANCLKQVLVLHFFLNQRDIPSTLHIGIRKNSEQLLDAHSWLECAGIPLIDSKNSLQQFSSIHSQSKHTKSLRKH